MVAHNMASCPCCIRGCIQKSVENSAVTYLAVRGVQLRLTFFCIDEPVGSGSYKQLLGKVGFIHSSEDSSRCQTRVSNNVEWRSRWTGNGDKVNLPTEINRRHPEHDEGVQNTKDEPKES